MIPQHILELQPHATWRRTNYGGFISHTAHVADDTSVCEGAAVYGNARIEKGARVINGAHVFESAIIETGACVSRATVRGTARVGRNATVDGSTLLSTVSVPERTQIGKGVFRKLPFVKCGRWTALYTGRGRVKIGCTQLRVDQWLGDKGARLKRVHQPDAHEYAVLKAWIGAYANEAKERAQVKAKSQPRTKQPSRSRKPQSSTRRRSRA